LEAVLSREERRKDRIDIWEWNFIDGYNKRPGNCQ
jgi:hypothetical protein